MDWTFLIEGKDSLLVSTDTRNLPSGCIFFALKGANFNGNDYALQALENGASYAVVDDDIPQTCSMRQSYAGRLLRVENTLLALQDLAHTWRTYLGTPIIGITGTNGKTTTKELLATVLSTRYRTHYTQGNLNNSIGVPLTLLQLTREHEIAIVEMGASHPGDIRELVEIAAPNYGLITNVGKAHLQGFGSFEGVMRTKEELYDYVLAHGGTLFRNADNPYLAQMYQDACDRYGNGTTAPEACIMYHTSTMPEGTHLVGAYNSENIQAALCVGAHFGVDIADGLAAIRDYVPSNNRSQRMQTAHNTLIVDAYNANPTSMQAAIDAFANSQRSSDEQGLPTAYILGAMRELGEYAHTEHQNIVNMLLERKAENVLLVGEEYTETTAPYPVYADVDALSKHLKEQPMVGYIILIKGSRSNQLEKIIPLL